ncbi:protein translocase SEC61 complex subunit gamma [Candidatus Woesearchaeota archaeon]|nr:protein translocase SEC61 complex subunit gamma [Candidatus Woesearchaeota archaeon]
MEFQQQVVKPSVFFKIKRFGKECMRVLKITKKPDSVEFKTIVKVTGIGILIIGAIGFAIHLIVQMI